MHILIRITFQHYTNILYILILVYIFLYLLQVTELEIQSTDEQKCHLALQKGEAASFRSADYPKLTFPQSVTLALMTL